MNHEEEEEEAEINKRNKNKKIKINKNKLNKVKYEFEKDNKQLWRQNNFLCNLCSGYAVRLEIGKLNAYQKLSFFKHCSKNR